MNAHADIEIGIELPGRDELVRAEIGIVREDCERLERAFRATCTAIAGINRDMAALRTQYQALKRRQAELDITATTEKRLLQSRKRVLFEMEEELRG